LQTKHAKDASLKVQNEKHLLSFIFCDPFLQGLTFGKFNANNYCLFRGEKTRRKKFSNENM